MKTFLKNNLGFVLGLIGVFLVIGLIIFLSVNITKYFDKNQKTPLDTAYFNKHQNQLNKRLSNFETKLDCLKTTQKITEVKREIVVIEKQQEIILNKIKKRTNETTAKIKSYDSASLSKHYEFWAKFAERE